MHHTTSVLIWVSHFLVEVSNSTPLVSSRRRRPSSFSATIHINNPLLGSFFHFSNPQSLIYLEKRLGNRSSSLREKLEGKECQISSIRSSLTSKLPVLVLSAYKYTAPFSLDPSGKNSEGQDTVETCFPHQRSRRVYFSKAIWKSSILLFLASMLQSWCTLISFREFLKQNHDDKPTYGSSRVAG